MATSTPYLNLVKPSYSETADIGVLNENADIIDQAVSAQAQAIAGKPDNATEMPLGSNDTTPVSQAIANLQNEIGIVCTGNTCAISASTGQYVVLKNSTISGRADGLYTAAKTIPANTEIDSTYLTAVSNGGLNNLKGQVDALNSKITSDSGVQYIRYDGNNSYVQYRKIGNVVTVFMYHKVSSRSIAAWSNLIFPDNLPEGFRPSILMTIECITDRPSSTGCSFMIATSGQVYIAGRYAGATDTGDILQATISYPAV